MLSDIVENTKKDILTTVIRIGNISPVDIQRKNLNVSEVGVIGKSCVPCRHADKQTDRQIDDNGEGKCWKKWLSQSGDPQHL